MPEFTKVGMQYYFKNTAEGEKPTSIIFAKQDQIFALNYDTEVITTIETFEPPLKCQPEIFALCENQQYFCVASKQDGLHGDFKSEGDDVDLDKLFGIGLICDVIYDGETKEFYFLCNKKDGKIGFYLIKFNEEDPSKFSYLTMWNHKLDIGDVNMQIMRDNERDCKELLIGYKTIYINTYNLVVIDLAGDEEKRATLFRHEAFQLWESSVFGMNLSISKDFVSLSKTGMNVLAMGSIPKKELKGSDGSKKMIHSLDSLSYLKVDPLNFINFKCQDYGNRVISIE
jgi:hypothetical protein